MSAITLGKIPQVCNGLTREYLSGIVKRTAVLIFHIDYHM